MTDQIESSEFSGLSGRKKRTSLGSFSTSLNALAREPTCSAMRFSSSSNTSHRRLVKISGRMKSLNFGASCAPRMLQAASQIQDSSDFCFTAFAVMEMQLRSEQPAHAGPGTADKRPASTTRTRYHAAVEHASACCRNAKRPRG